MRDAGGKRPDRAGGYMAKVSWNKTWSGKMRKKVRKRNGKNRIAKKKK